MRRCPGVTLSDNDNVVNLAKLIVARADLDRKSRTNGGVEADPSREGDYGNDVRNCTVGRRLWQLSGSFAPGHRTRTGQRERLDQGRHPSVDRPSRNTARRQDAATDGEGASSPAERAGQATMHDVAAAARVSLKTVSRVVNRERRASVLELAESAWSKTPSPHSWVQTKCRRSQPAHRPPIGSIGLIVADLMNPFYSSVAKAVEGVAIRHNAVIIIGSSGENANVNEKLVMNLLHRPSTA